MARRSVWRDADRIKLWTRQTVSDLESIVTHSASSAAILTLHPSAIGAGIRVASASIAVLLVGLFGGAPGPP